MTYSKELHEKLRNNTRGCLCAWGDDITSLLDEIDRVTAENAEHKWVSVSERLPEKESKDLGEQYLVIVNPMFGKPIVAAMDFIKGEWFTGSFGCSTNWTKRVSYWQHLPTPPAGGEDHE